VRRYQIWILILVAVLAVLQYRAVMRDRSGPSGLDSGTEAPALEATLPNGDAVTLDDFGGQTVVVGFWATWCGPCRQELPALAAALRERSPEDRASDNAVYLWIGSGELPEAAKAYLEDPDYAPIDFAFDTNHRLSKPWAVKGIPSVYVVDAERKIRDHFVGFGDDSVSKILSAVERARRAVPEEASR
jgi:thiol-disulfide isomerase/thioredoxin